MCWDHANLLCFVKSWTKCRSTMTVEGKKAKNFMVYVPSNTQAMTMQDRVQRAALMQRARAFRP